MVNYVSFLLKALCQRVVLPLHPRPQSHLVRCLNNNFRYASFSSIMGGPIEASIRKKLSATFQPEHLEVINESYMHKVPKDAEMHFKVVIISEMFQSLPLIKRHRLVNDALLQELEAGLHALSIVAKTPAQWTDSGQKFAPSPPCKGGAGL